MSRLRVAALIVLWCGAAATGLAKMFCYEFTPAATTLATADWPSDSRLQRVEHKSTLVMFIHPHCPCSRASLVELNKLVSSCEQPLALNIVFIRPAKFTEGWEQTSLFSLAAKIPGAHAFTDQNGREAEKFGVTTSGETLLYTPSGKLVFHGGLTAARGHEGESSGQDAIRTLIDSNDTTARRAPVFGCALSKTTQ